MQAIYQSIAAVLLNQLHQRTVLEDAVYARCMADLEQLSFAQPPNKEELHVGFEKDAQRAKIG